MGLSTAAIPLRRLLLTCTTAALVSPCAALAQESSLETAAQADLWEATALNAWLEGFMASHLKELPSAGASVAIVKDGEVLVARGLCFASAPSRSSSRGRR